MFRNSGLTTGIMSSAFTVFFLGAATLGNYPNIGIHAVDLSMLFRTSTNAYYGSL